MSSDDDIPVLREAVRRKGKAALSEAQIQELCFDLSMQAGELTEQLVADAIREAELQLRTTIRDQLNQQLSGLIETVVREKLRQAGK